MTRRRPHHARTTILTALACALAGLWVSAPPAAAEVTRHDGSVLFTSVINCDSQIWGYPYSEAGVGTVAGAIYDDAAPPRIGDVFYVDVEVSAVGNPYPCLDQKMRPDLILPAGVSLAISEADPIRCVKWDYTSGGATETPETTLCPTTAHAPQSGGTVGFGTASGEFWTIPTGIGYEVQVPVVASKSGYLTFEFPVQIIDGNDNPILRPTSDFVYVEPGSTPPPGGAAEVATSVAPTVKLARTRGRVPACVTASPEDSRVRLSVLARRAGTWARIGSTTYSVTSVDPTRVKVAVTDKWRRALKGERARAKLVATITSPAGKTARATEKFWVKG